MARIAYEIRGSHTADQPRPGRPWRGARASLIASVTVLAALAEAESGNVATLLIANV